MRPNRTEKASVLLSAADLTSRLRGQEAWPEISQLEDEKAVVAAKDLFLRVATNHQIPISKRVGHDGRRVAMWAEALGRPDMLMPIFGPTHDMLVVSRPKPGGGRKAMTMMMQALLTSQRPVLLMPQEETNISGKSIAIAWNGGSFESRTLQVVLPLLAKADDVILLTVGRDLKHGPKARHMVQYLKHHAIKAREVKSGNAKSTGDRLVEMSRAEGADVLVSGAYSKGRLFETVFGGVSEHLIAKTDMPVLMMHH